MTEPLPAPPYDPDAAPFRAAARDGRLLLPVCRACRRPHWYPRAACPFCGGEVDRVEASGRGEIYSYTVVRRVPVPYAPAYVTLIEGPTMMTRIVDCDPDRLRVGLPVRLAFVPAADGTPVPCFRPSP